MPRGRAILLGACALLAVILGVFAYLIADSQAQAREDLEKRFRDRAVVTAAVAQAVFLSTQNNPPVQALTAPRVSPRALGQIARQGRLSYLAVLDGRGRVLATNPGAPAAASAPLRPDLRPALRGHPTLSPVIGGATPRQAVIQWAIPVPLPGGGRRVELLGVPLPAFSKFLASFLSEIPNRSGAAGVVLDQNGRVVGSPDADAPAGRVYRDRAVIAPSRRAAAGSYERDGVDRYFASAPLKTSPWKIVVAADKSRLFASINGSRRLIPWLVLVVLGLVGVGGLLALRRAALAQAEIERRTLSRRYALEINDNVIQRLAVVKFALERGQESATEEKLNQALQEAQKLVNELLGEDDTRAGELRRTGRAPAQL